MNGKGGSVSQELTGKQQQLPPIICGPILRRTTVNQVVIWWVSPKKCGGYIHFFSPADAVSHNQDGDSNFDASNTPLLSVKLSEENLTVLQFGKEAFVHLADIRLKDTGSLCQDAEHSQTAFPIEKKIEYDLIVSKVSAPRGFCDRHDKKETVDHVGHLHESSSVSLSKSTPHLLYPDQTRPSFVIKKHIRRFFHGSCRKPHHDSDDAFIGLDKEIMLTIDDMEHRPAFLMLTGDQIYADDVAGPMLKAIHQVIDLLGIYGEEFDGAIVADSHELYRRRNGYYSRKKVLPRTKVGDRWFKRGGVKHIFSSGFAHNHMITFGEWMAMYLLVWSPVLWEFISTEYETNVPDKYVGDYRNQRRVLNDFRKDLPDVQRLLAHIPTYMIFDDHDITDDWNLTAKWEEQAYGHPFTKRIIGNGLMAYFLCQGWGNAPNVFKSPAVKDEKENRAVGLMQSATAYFNSPDKQNHDAFIESLLVFKHWHYEVPYTPELVVMDSRTRRWKRDRMPASPSGLLDWEALMKLQHKLMRSDAVLLVAPGPIFGVKLIELIQRLFTMFGYSLAVDAENWMAHRKSAYVLLEIFKNAKTASRNVIVSGDVHYSFAYDVELRYTKNCPGIWQITSSGIKNEFPGGILKWLDRVNQIMYSPYSPLNWFTKRRDLVIYERRPKINCNFGLNGGGVEKGAKSKQSLGYGKQRLVNACGIGRVTLNSEGVPIEIAEIYADGSSLVFKSDESRSG